MTAPSGGHGGRPDPGFGQPGQPHSDDGLDPDVVARIVLMSLPGAGPARLSWLLSELSPADAVAHLAAGSFRTSRPLPRGMNANSVNQWGRLVRSRDLAALVAAQFVKGRRVLGPGHGCWPFHDDPEPPLLLFCAGDVELLTADRLVSVVGTRRCSAAGRRVAHGFGLDLARSGVGVVSGLAIGVDAAVHQGCLDGGGRPVAVVASGLDVVYPEANKSLWHDVVKHGLVVSEAPAGVSPRRWRFPARNRMIAALGRGTVIVESHRRGGALITADQAADRGRPVMAVPGSVLSPSAAGCNDLLVDGAAPVRDVVDVLDILGIDPTPPPSTSLDSNQPQVTSPDALFDVAGDSQSGPVGASPLSDRMVAELMGGPATVDDLVSVTGSVAGDVLNALTRLSVAGAVVFDGVTASLP